MLWGVDSSFPSLATGMLQWVVLGRISVNVTFWILDSYHLTFFERLGFEGDRNIIALFTVWDGRDGKDETWADAWCCGTSVPPLNC